MGRAAACGHDLQRHQELPVERGGSRLRRRPDSQRR
jgi:hypothetical protein